MRYVLLTGFVRCSIRTNCAGRSAWRTHVRDASDCKAERIIVGSDRRDRAGVVPALLATPRLDRVVLVDDDFGRVDGVQGERRVRPDDAADFIEQPVQRLSA